MMKLMNVLSLMVLTVSLIVSSGCSKKKTQPEVKSEMESVQQIAPVVVEEEIVENVSPSEEVKEAASSAEAELSGAEVVTEQLNAETSASESASISDEEISEQAEALVIPEISEMQAESISESVNSTETVVAVSDSSKGFRGNFAIGHVTGIEKNDRSFSEISARLGYGLGGRHEVGVRQDLKKLYTITENLEDEALFEDTQLYYQYALARADLNEETGALLRLTTTLPVSKRSSDLERITRTTLELEMERPFLNRKISIGLTPAVSYAFSQYTTSKSLQPIERFTAGALAKIQWHLVPEKFSLVAWGAGKAHVFAEYQDRNETPSPTTSADYGLHADYRIGKKISLQAGYLNSNSFLTNMASENYFYDESTDRLFAALKLEF